MPTVCIQNVVTCYIPSLLEVGEELQQNAGVALETLSLCGERSHTREGCRGTAKVVWYGRSQGCCFRK